MLLIARPRQIRSYAYHIPLQKRYQRKEDINLGLDCEIDIFLTKEKNETIINRSNSGGRHFY